MMADELLEALKDVAHEVAGFESAGQHLDNAFAWTAWYIHLRALRDFFRCSKPAKPDDLWVGMYLDKPGEVYALLARVSPPAGTVLEDLGREADKLAAHPTLERSRLRLGRTRVARVGPLAEAQKYYLDLAEEFGRMLSHDGQPKAFSQALADERERLG